MKCATCQAENPDTAKFCNNCGARLEFASRARETPARPSPTPPPSEPLVFAEFEGSTDIVTDNFDAAPCEKAVLVWSVMPNSFGTAAIHVRLHKVGADWSRNLVLRFEQDFGEDLAGEAFQALASGVYFMVIKNASGPWALKWECRD